MRTTPFLSFMTSSPVIQEDFEGSFVPSFMTSSPVIQEDQSRICLDKKDNMNLIKCNLRKSLYRRCFDIV